MILDVYIWWAEGVHLRSQPHTERGVRRWNPALINDLLEDVLPFDQQAEAYPPRSTLLDAHLGAALMQMTAMIYAELIGMPREPDPQESLRRNYRTTDGKVRFVPGGENYFDELLRPYQCSRRVGNDCWRSSIPVGCTPSMHESRRRTQRGKFF